MWSLIIFIYQWKRHDNCLRSLKKSLKSMGLILGTTGSHGFTKFEAPIPYKLDSISIGLFAKASLLIWLAIYPTEGIHSVIGLPADECNINNDFQNLYFYFVLIYSREKYSYFWLKPYYIKYILFF